MALDTLRDLYIDELKDTFNAEKQLVKALPKMAKKADAPELRRAFEEHLAQTQEHVVRIQQVMTELGLPERGKTCKGIAGIISEGAALMEEDAEPAVMDAGLIAGGQRAEHYEMAAYGTLRAYAETLGLANAARLHQQTLDEEKKADQKLSELAEGFINALAEENDEQPAAKSVMAKRGPTGSRSNGARSSGRAS